MNLEKIIYNFEEMASLEMKSNKSEITQTPKTSVLEQITTKSKSRINKDKDERGKIIETAVASSFTQLEKEYLILSGDKKEKKITVEGASKMEKLIDEYEGFLVYIINLSRKIKDEKDDKKSK